MSSNTPSSLSTASPCPSSHSAITFRDLSFSWPDGTVVVSRLNGTITTGRTGLVGRNGVGKSTLLGLVAGVHSPTSGHIDVVGDVGYLAQTLTLQRDATVADLLGVAGTIAAIRAIESGDVADHQFEAVGDDWDIEHRADEVLHDVGFSAADLDRRVDQLSGGETMLIAITGLRLRRTPVSLLDEPTNNLDRPTRERVASLIDDWPGTLIVVSHDTGLLDHMERTAELHQGALDVFGGPYRAWREHADQRQAAAIQAARTAEQALKVERRQRVEAETKLARRERTARATQRDGGIPRIVAGNRASRAQGSAGALRTELNSKVTAAEAAATAAAARVRDDIHIRLELPDPDVPARRRIAEIVDGERTFVIQGPERVALVGPNGTGKSTLLDGLVQRRPGTGGRPSATPLTDRVGYLPQRLDGLDDTASALDNVASAAPATPIGVLRGQLARLLLRGSDVERPVSTLSGGERFRVALARLLLADPPAQLLVLDEPTNNLDLATVDQLVDALGSYRGALLVVSHDDAFLGRIGIDTVLELDDSGRLHMSGLGQLERPART